MRTGRTTGSSRSSAPRCGWASCSPPAIFWCPTGRWWRRSVARGARSEEHTSELQSPCNLVCRLLLEKKKHTSELLSPYKLVSRLLLAGKRAIMEPQLTRLLPLQHLSTVLSRRQATICPLHSLLLDKA